MAGTDREDSGGVGVGVRIFLLKEFVVVMKQTSFLAAVILILLPLNALACSIGGYPVEENFKRSQLVVLARPIGFSYLPKESAKPGYEGSYRQTILWEVLVNWKGGVKVGDKFTTRRTYGDVACTGYFSVDSKDARLIFARGAEPFADFDHYDINHPMGYYFKFLATKDRK